MHQGELIVIRHARSMNNVRQSDDLDAPLTEFGERQATNVGKFLEKHKGFGNPLGRAGWHCYTSPFLRCLQTANLIGREIPLMFSVREELREYINHAGHEVHVPQRGDSDVSGTFNWGQYPMDGRTYRQEWNEELVNRIHEFYQYLQRLHKRQDVAGRALVVTHGLPAMVLVHVATQPWSNTVPIWDHSLDNASISYIVNGRIVWYGRNLYHECEHDPFDKERPYDKSDLLKTP